MEMFLLWVMPNVVIQDEIRRVLELEGNAILKCAERLRDPAPFEKALSLMNQALGKGGKIVVSGVGKSGKVGQKVAATLCSTGSLAVFLHPTEGLHGDLGLLAAQDVVLAITYTGNTEELLQLMPSMKARKIAVIGIGGNAHSRIAQQCDVWLDASVEQEACPHNLAPTTSTTLALAVGDALAVTLMKLRGFNADAFALNHPGGSLGKKLNLRVSDLMHQGDKVACVAPQSSMDDVVVALTRMMLGIALVVEGGKLLGIITDGDLRRALQHRAKFFDLKAQDVMTKHPITILPEAMASEALELMENRPRQINVLPVVDAQGHWKGVVRVHDLISSF